MVAYVKKVVAVSALLMMILPVFGCGDKEVNGPAIKLTASEVSSQTDTTAHIHIVGIPFTAFSASPSDNIYQYRSSTTGGHSHVIALTRQQMIDINNGMRVVAVSSVPDSGTVHTHSWNIRGGDLLYEKNCYNCHTNDKRGRSPMNVSFSASQTSSVISPNSAPLSVSAPTTPDPYYMPSTVVSLDGAALYAANCAACHGTLASSAKQNKTFTQIKDAITNNSGGMFSLGSLSDAQLQAIAASLVK